jgi:hypothetical protein
MDVRIVDLIAADFVVVGVELLNSPQSIQRFGNTFDEFRWMSVTQAQNGFGDGKRISLDRDRIYIDLISGRSRVRQEFTSREKLPDLAKLTSRAIQFTDNCPSTAEAFGFNVEVSYDSTQGESAFSYIGRTMFSGLRKIDSWNLIGGLAAVDSRMMMVSFETSRLSPDFVTTPSIASTFSAISTLSAETFPA